MLPAEQLALWADRLRDMAVLGLRFARSEADLRCYEALAQVLLTLWATATCLERPAAGAATQSAACSERDASVNTRPRQAGQSGAMICAKSG